MTKKNFNGIDVGKLNENLYNRMFANTYIGAVFVCGGTVLFSALIIALSNKIKWLKNLY